MIYSKKTIIFAVAFLLLIFGFYFYSSRQTGEKGIYCTQDAKLCPDGSYVGRVPPNCEFETCPAVNNLWGTFTDGERKLSFQYPRELAAQYIDALDWPPQVQVLNEPFSCTEAGDESARAGGTKKITIEGREYCVTKVTEGAAGSIYTQYAYAFSVGEQTVIFTFTLRFSQCGNYGDPQKTACENERASFDIDSMINRITQTFRFWP